MTKTTAAILTLEVRTKWNHETDLKNEFTDPKHHINHKSQSQIVET